jgi:dTDP-4-dehydrorhamnose 3,5-epimerase-like enzyme
MPLQKIELNVRKTCTMSSQNARNMSIPRHVLNIGVVRLSQKHVGLISMRTIFGPKAPSIPKLVNFASVALTDWSTTLTQLSLKQYDATWT